VTTTHIYNAPVGIAVTMTLDEETGDFVTTCDPKPRKDQLPEFTRDYRRWCRFVGAGWARRHGGKANVTFVNSLKGKIALLGNVDRFVFRRTDGPPATPVTLVTCERHSPRRRDA
jgi:hypothetical protein